MDHCEYLWRARGAWVPCSMPPVSRGSSLFLAQRSRHLLVSRASHSINPPINLCRRESEWPTCQLSQSAARHSVSSPLSCSTPPPHASCSPCCRLRDASGTELVLVALLQEGATLPTPHHCVSPCRRCGSEFDASGTRPVPDRAWMSGYTHVARPPPTLPAFSIDAMHGIQLDSP